MYLIDWRGVQLLNSKILNLDLQLSYFHLNIEVLLSSTTVQDQNPSIQDTRRHPDYISWTSRDCKSELQQLKTFKSPTTRVTQILEGGGSGTVSWLSRDIKDAGLFFTVHPAIFNKLALVVLALPSWMQSECFSVMSWIEIHMKFIFWNPTLQELRMWSLEIGSV